MIKTKDTEPFKHFLGTRGWQVEPGTNEYEVVRAKKGKGPYTQGKNLLQCYRKKNALFLTVPAGVAREEALAYLNQDKATCPKHGAITEQQMLVLAKDAKYCLQCFADLLDDKIGRLT